VFAQQFKHVIKKTDPRVNAATPLAIKIQRQFNIRLRRFAFPFRFSPHNLLHCAL
jgi:hypothetical protein